MSAVKCEHAEGGECTASIDCWPIGRGLQCPRLRENGLLRFFNPANSIAIIWSIEDIQGKRSHLTNEQAMEVLEEVSDSHDANYGVNWDTLHDTADLLYPKENDEEEKKEEE